MNSNDPIENLKKLSSFVREIVTDKNRIALIEKAEKELDDAMRNCKRNTLQEEICSINATFEKMQKLVYALCYATEISQPNDKVIPHLRYNLAGLNIQLLAEKEVFLKNYIVGLRQKNNNCYTAEFAPKGMLLNKTA